MSSKKKRDIGKIMDIFQLNCSSWEVLIHYQIYFGSLDVAIWRLRKFISEGNIVSYIEDR